jgi:hypothetical protein
VVFAGEVALGRSGFLVAIQIADVWAFSDVFRAIFRATVPTRPGCTTQSKVYLTAAVVRRLNPTSSPAHSGFRMSGRAFDLRRSSPWDSFLGWGFLSVALRLAVV